MLKNSLKPIWLLAFFFAGLILLNACANPIPSTLTSPQLTHTPRSTAPTETHTIIFVRTRTESEIVRELTRRAALPIYTVTPGGTNAPRSYSPTPTPAGIVRPTAQFTTLLPLSEWKTYSSPENGFSIRYPPDWIVSPLPPNECWPINRCFPSFYSYDPRDFKLFPKGGPIAPNLFEIEIGYWDDTMGRPLPAPNENFPDYVATRTTNPPGVGDQLLYSEIIRIGGVESVLRVTELNDKVTSIFVPRQDYVFILMYWEPQIEYNNQVLKMMLDSIVFFEPASPPKTPTPN